jgi:hypothetical protein
MATGNNNGTKNGGREMTTATMIKKLEATIKEEQADLKKLREYVCFDPTSYEHDENLYQRGVAEGKIELAAKILKALGSK